MKPYGTMPAWRSRVRPELPNQSNVPAPIGGLLAGTPILTRNGETLVEDIQAGDHIITRTQGLTPVIKVSRRKAMVHLISFAAGSLGDTRPETELTVPFDQQVLIRDWRAKAMFGQPQAIVPAHELVDGEFICDEGLKLVDLCILTFSRPHVIYAGGMEVAAASMTGLDLRPAA